MSGTQLLTEIRQLPVYQATPIIILSRLDEEREAALCIRLGATAYVQKASNFHTFFDSIKALVKHWLQSEGERDEEQS
jgi:DNA-binding response OmpR family regulator